MVSEVKSYCFPELGYFSKRQLLRIKELLEGKTFMRFQISWSEFGENCNLIVKTDYYDKDASYEENAQEVKNFFLYCIISALAKK